MPINKDQLQNTGTQTGVRILVTDASLCRISWQDQLGDQGKEDLGKSTLFTLLLLW